MIAFKSARALAALSRASRVALVISAAAVAAGCAATFKEQHYYQSIDPKSGDITNYYRLQVSGFGALTSARYVSGYYDERAVDLFFNEVKVAETPATATGTQQLFPTTNVLDPGTQEVIKPLSPDEQHGAFVMILSTNASSVTRTIGQFAENQVVADAVTNLTNRDVLLQGKTALVAQKERADATSAELSRMMALVPAGDMPAAAETSAALVRVLNTIASGMSQTPTTFTTLDEAAAWFARP